MRDYITKGVRGEIPENPQPKDPLFQKVTNILIGSAKTSAEAVKQYLSEKYSVDHVSVFSHDLQGMDIYFCVPFEPHLVKEKHRNSVGIFQS